MKKIISLILSLTFVLSAVPAFAAETEPENNKKVSELSALGILNDMSSVDFDSERTIVKKVFYSAIYNIMTDDAESDSTLVSFLGRYNIKIDEAELRDNITRGEALKAVVCMLGYTYSALTSDELLSAADNLGLRKYVSGSIDGDITLGESVNLLYAAISEDMLAISVGTKNGKFSFERLKDVTPLNHYRDIYVVKGYVNKNGHASIVDNTPAIKGHVYIDDEDFSAGVTNAGDYIGMPVTSYVQYDDDDDGTILYIAPNDRFVTVTSLDADEIISVSDDVKSVEYELGDKAKTARLSSVVKVIYNGKNCTDYTKDDLMPDIGSVELIDSDNDKTIDVVNIKSYKTILVNYISQYSEEIISKYNDPSVLDIDSEENEITIEKDGKEISISDIKPNNIVLAAKSRSGSDEIIKLLVSDKEVSARLSGADYAERELYADGGTYNLSEAYYKAIKDETITFVSELNIGKNYSLYLDAFGNVAYAVLTDGKNYMYATRLWYDDAEDRYGVKVFTTEGEWKNYELADKTKLNGKVPETDSERGNSALYAILAKTDLNENGATQFTPQLIRAEFNSDGKIKEIETAEESKTENENKFIKYDMSRTRIYTNEGMTFGGDVWGTKDTKVFILPTDRSDEENYRLTGMSWFKLDSWYQVSAYDIDKFYQAKAITYESDSKTADRDRYFIKSISATLVDGEERDEYKCLYNGSEITLVNKSGYTLPELKVGDVMRIAKNASGEITYAERYTELKKDIEKTYPSTSDPTKMHASAALAAGVVKDVGIDEGMFTADCGLETPARFKFLSNTRCYLYDGSEKEKVKVITPSDIAPGDNVYVYISYTRASDVYVMRNIK